MSKLSKKRAAEALKLSLVSKEKNVIRIFFIYGKQFAQIVVDIVLPLV